MAAIRSEVIVVICVPFLQPCRHRARTVRVPVDLTMPRGTDSRLPDAYCAGAMLADSDADGGNASLS